MGDPPYINGNILSSNVLTTRVGMPERRILLKEESQS
jgi:hypothetical protein